MLDEKLSYQETSERHKVSVTLIGNLVRSKKKGNGDWHKLKAKED